MRTHIRDVSRKINEEPIKYKEGVISYYLTRVLFSHQVFYKLLGTDV